MKVLLNYGAGVNSTAMLIKVAEQDCWKDNEIHVIFSDTSCEHPETMSYIEDHAKPFCDKVGFKFITVKSALGSLIDYCEKLKFIPSRRFRWCTDKFKQRPITAYQKAYKPDISLIGIDASEDHRANTDDVLVRFPLVEGNIDRQDCITIIKNAGLPVPRKSGCFICPFQRKDHWAFLRRDYPELFQIAVDLEGASQEAHAKDFFFSSNKRSPLLEWLRDYEPKESGDQIRFDIDPDKDMPCFCTT